MVRYRFSAAKALQAIDYMASANEALDLHTALKTCYFSDKSHLNEHLQPIFGATYKAMKYGPVPLEIYEMIKGESIWLSELGVSAMPWRLDGFRIIRQSNGAASLDQLADSEQEHFLAAFQRSRILNFTERTAATHGPDWQAANGGEMRYEDMIDAGPDVDAKIEFIRDTARHIRL